MAKGVYSGVTDVIVKPIEGAKKESVSGFGKGFLQGIGGLVAKPVSGFLELLSKTTEGIKNTVSSNDEDSFKPVRKPRTFYGTFKYVRRIFLIYFI
jgi:vacuolar protein sorting-associated protein 13A/C